MEYWCFKGHEYGYEWVMTVTWSPWKDVKCKGRTRQKKKNMPSVQDWLVVRRQLPKPKGNSGEAVQKLATEILNHSLKPRNWNPTHEVLCQHIEHAKKETDKKTNRIEAVENADIFFLLNQGYFWTSIKWPQKFVCSMMRPWTNLRAWPLRMSVQINAPIIMKGLVFNIIKSRVDW